MIHHHYYAYILAVACVLLSSVVNRNPAPSEGAHFSPQRRFKSETACLVSPSPYLLSVVIPTSPSPSPTVAPALGNNLSPSCYI